jgi:hypothetical protein
MKIIIKSRNKGKLTVVGKIFLHFSSTERDFGK